MKLQRCVNCKRLIRKIPHYCKVENVIEASMLHKTKDGMKLKVRGKGK